MSKIDEFFKSFCVVGYIRQTQRYNTIVALSAVVSQRVTIVAPKIYHKMIQEQQNGATILTPEYLVRHPDTPLNEIILRTHVFNKDLGTMIAIVYKGK